MKIKEGFILRKVGGSNVIVPTGNETNEFNGMITTNENYNLDEIIPKLKEYTVTGVVKKVSCDKIEKYVPGVTQSHVPVIEGIVKIIIFIGYLLLISLMKDIQRTFMYHGAEHKCINCIETGKVLTVENVASSSRFHKRCGTSFLLIVMVISIIFFVLIRTDIVWLR